MGNSNQASDWEDTIKRQPRGPNWHPDLIPFVQFKKREKHPLEILKVTLLHGCFLRFLNWTNGTKSHKISHMKIYLECGKLYYPLSSTKWWWFVTKSCIFWSIYKVRTHIVPCDVTIPVAVDLWSYWEQMMLQGRQAVQESCNDDSKKLTIDEEITWWKIKSLFLLITKN